MKKSGEDLKQAQEAMDYRRELLESGKIRILPDKSTPSSEHQDKAQGQKNEAPTQRRSSVSSGRR